MKGIATIKTQDFSVSRLFSSIETLKKASERFLSTDGFEAAPLSGLAEDLTAFEMAFERALQEQRPSTALTFLARADRLSGALKATREALERIASALVPEVTPDTPEQLGTLSVVLSSDIVLFSACVQKLRALDALYSQLASLFDLADSQHAARLVKVESGSLFTKLFGEPRITKLMADFIEASAGFLYRNYTREGRSESLPRQVAAIESLLSLRGKLAAEGIETAGMDARIESASVAVAAALDTLLAGEARVDVNGNMLSVGDAAVQRYLAETRLRQLPASTSNEPPPPTG